MREHAPKVWGGLALGLIVADVLAWPVVTVALLGIFVIYELLAAFKLKAKGDTWSEFNWSLVKKRPALIPPVLGGAVWLVWQFVEVSAYFGGPGAEIVQAVGFDLGFWALVSTGTLWLLIHMAFRGRYG